MIQFDSYFLKHGLKPPTRLYSLVGQNIPKSPPFTLSQGDICWCHVEQKSYLNVNMAETYESNTAIGMMYIHNIQSAQFPRWLAPRMLCWRIIIPRILFLAAPEKDEKKFFPSKTNMTGWEITIFNRRYIFKWLVFQCHVSFPGCT